MRDKPTKPSSEIAGKAAEPKHIIVKWFSSPSGVCFPARRSRPEALDDAEPYPRKDNVDFPKKVQCQSLHPDTCLQPILWEQQVAQTCVSACPEDSVLCGFRGIGGCSFDQ